MITKQKSKNISRNKSRNKSRNISRNISENIINILTIVKNYYATQQNNIHVNAYERAIYQIKHWGKPITKGRDLAHLVGIGKGMIDKIDTIIETGTLPIIKEKGLNINLDTKHSLDTKKLKKIKVKTKIRV